MSHRDDVVVVVLVVGGRVRTRRGSEITPAPRAAAPQCDSVTSLWVDAGGAGGAGGGPEVWSGGPASLKIWDLRAGRLLRSLDGAAPLTAVDPPAGGAFRGPGGGTCVVSADPDCRQVAR